MTRFLLAIFLCIWTFPAIANDVDVAKRGVARIIVVTETPDRRQGISMGSGFAVASDKVVTNEHVINLARRFPKYSVILVVPSEGSKPYAARLVKADASKDLALLTVINGKLPELTIYSGALESGEDVATLGYPGNVDKATIRNARDYITPREPTLAEGNFSNLQTINGISALVHSAKIARGNSGGPLVDECGRILGVNTFQTNNDSGDSAFAFASSSSELMRFLRGAGQSFRTIADTCVTAEEFAAQERAREEAEERKRIADEERAAQQQQQAREKAERKAERAIMDDREQKQFIAIMMLIAGALAAGGGGYLAAQNAKSKNTGVVMVVGGIVMVIGGVLVFITRPALSDDEIEMRIEQNAGGTATARRLSGDDANNELSNGSVNIGSNAIAASDSTQPGQNRYSCQIDRSRGRLTTSSSEDVNLTWNDNGCINGTKQYAPDSRGRSWSRILVPDETATVSRLSFDPSTSILTVDKFALGLGAMEEARNLRARISTDSCTADVNAISKLAERQKDIAKILPAAPSEKLVYNCTAR